MRQHIYCTYRESFPSSPYRPPHLLSGLNRFLMSQTAPATASASSNFQSIFNAALEDYKRKTNKDLLKHGLTTQLEHCQSASAILDVLYRQPRVQQFIQSRTDSGSSKQWLSATATVLCAFSAALGQGVGMVSLLEVHSSTIYSLILVPQVFSPANVIFTGIGVLFIVRNIPCWV
jgi:hypothetical protein